MDPPYGAHGVWGQYPRFGGEGDLKKGRGSVHRPGSPPGGPSMSCLMSGRGEDIDLVDHPTTVDCRGVVTAWSYPKKEN